MRQRGKYVTDKKGVKNNGSADLKVDKNTELIRFKFTLLW